MCSLCLYYRISFDQLSTSVASWLEKNLNLPSGMWAQLQPLLVLTVTQQSPSYSEVFPASLQEWSGKYTFSSHFCYLSEDPRATKGRKGGVNSIIFLRPTAHNEKCHGCFGTQFRLPPTPSQNKTKGNNTIKEKKKTQQNKNSLLLRNTLPESEPYRMISKKRPWWQRQPVRKMGESRLPTFLLVQM